MASLRHFNRASILLVPMLFLSVPAMAQQPPEKYAGRVLAEVLRALQAGGLRIVFSSELVTPEMRVLGEPRAKVAREVLDELLAAHGLKAESGPSGVVQIVRSTPPASIDARKQAVAAIHGRVVDGATAVPLPGVLVQVVGTQQSTRTDDKGRFQLRAVKPGAQTLSVSVAGYALFRRAIRIAGGSTFDITVALSHSTGTYSERVTVTAARLERQDPGVGSEVSLGGRELQTLSGVMGVDAMRAVQTLPRVAAGDDFRSEFSVRGSRYRHVGVVVDGVATPWLQHAVYGGTDTGSVAMLNSDVLEQATLQAGAYPHRYGDRLGAQLDLTLRQGSRATTQWRGSLSGTNASFLVDGPIGSAQRGSWLLTLRQTYLEWPSKLLKDIGSTPLSFTDAQAKIVYDVRPTQQVSFSFLGGRSSMDERGAGAPNELGLGRNWAGVLNLGWRSTLGANLVFSQRAYLVAHQFMNRNHSGLDRDAGTDREFSYRADVARTLFHGLFEAGAQIQRAHGSRQIRRYGEPAAGAVPPLQSVGGFDGSTWQRSAYAHFKWTATPRLTIAPGLRISDSTLVHRRTLSPWILGEWLVRPGWTLNASAGVSHQFPEIDQVFGGVFTQAPEARATGLGPERATHVDVGIEQRLTESVRWQATVFNRDEREMVREPDADPRLVGGLVTEPDAPGRYENALTGRSRGVELLLERRSGTGLSGWVAYSYGKTRHTDEARRETYWADFDQRHAINISGIYPFSDRTSVAVKFRGGTNFPIPGYLTARDGGLFIGGRRNDVRLPNYARLDVRANRTFTVSRRRLTLFVEVLNVLNRANRGLAQGFISRQTGEAARFTEPLFPRLPSVGLLIEF